MTTTCNEEEIPAPADETQYQQQQFAKSYNYELFKNVHLALPPPSPPSTSSNIETFYTRGDFSYFHYGCDGTQDAGWGCGYRTLQSVISWIINKRNNNTDLVTNKSINCVPSIEEIQKLLVRIGDKSESFVGSRDWIGTLEEFYIIDLLFELPCKILHTSELNSATIIAELRRYFEEYCGFIAMGGLSDTASKGIAGLHQAPNGIYLLVVDPHYPKEPISKQKLIDDGYVRWMHVKEFPAGAYNLCLPLQR